MSNVYNSILKGLQEIIDEKQNNSIKLKHDIVTIDLKEEIVFKQKDQ